MKKKFYLFFLIFLILYFNLNEINPSSQVTVNGIPNNITNYYRGMWSKDFSLENYFYQPHFTTIYNFLFPKKDFGSIALDIYDTEIILNDFHFIEVFIKKKKKLIL
jgi:hypothetical protein